MAVDPTTFVTQMIGLSVAAEHVTETVKQALSSLFGKLSPNLQSAATQVLAMGSSMFVVVLAHADPLSVLLEPFA
jgi:hypothetical protein